MGGQQRAKQKRLFKCSLGAVAVADAEQVIELAHKIGAQVLWCKRSLDEDLRFSLIE